MLAGTWSSRSWTASHIPRGSSSCCFVAVVISSSRGPIRLGPRDRVAPECSRRRGKIRRGPSIMRQRPPIVARGMRKAHRLLSKGGVACYDHRLVFLAAKYSLPPGAAAGSLTSADVTGEPTANVAPTSAFIVVVRAHALFVFIRVGAPFESASACWHIPCSALAFEFR